MARELGPAYLPFICEVLAAALPARGYTAHVLGHTVHAVVEGMHRVRCRVTPTAWLLCPGLTVPASGAQAVRRARCVHAWSEGTWLAQTA